MAKEYIKRSDIQKMEFYIPKDEVIPTRLRLKIDENIDVYYERLPNVFGYKFDFLKLQNVTIEMATVIMRLKLLMNCIQKNWLMRASMCR